jgi:hypothetical protein
MGHVGHADLIAVVHRRRAPQGEQQHGRDARLRAPDARRDARLVVVPDHPVRPRAHRQRRLVLRNHLGNCIRVPRALHQMKVEGKLRALEILAVVGRKLIEGEIDFSDEQAVAIRVQYRAHVRDDRMHLGRLVL